MVSQILTGGNLKCILPVNEEKEKRSLTSHINQLHRLLKIQIQHLKMYTGRQVTIPVY